MVGIRHVWLIGCWVVVMPVHGDSFAWRGDGSGRYPQATPPTEWAKDKNILWSTKVGSSRSSPVVIGDKVFVTSEPDLLLCLDKSSGRLLWRCTNGLSDLPAEKQPREERYFLTECGYATPTPCTDGKHIYALFGTGIIACYDLEGTRKWIAFIDVEQKEPHGRTASPVVVGNRLLVLVTCLIALDTETGKVVWQKEEVQPTFATPLALKIGEVDAVVAPQGEVVRVSDGKILAPKTAKAYCASAIVNGGTIFTIDSIAKAIRLPDKAGDALQPVELWAHELDGQPYASPVFHEGLIYGISKDSRYWVIDAGTGEVLLNRRLDFDAEISASISLAGNRLYLHSDAGTTLILEPGREGKIVARLSLPEGISGTPTFTGSQMFVRSGEKLHCIGK